MNLQSKGDPTTEREKTVTTASKQVKLNCNNCHIMVNDHEVKPTEVLLSTFQVTVDQLTKHEENMYDSPENLYKSLAQELPKHHRNPILHRPTEKRSQIIHRTN